MNEQAATSSCRSNPLIDADPTETIKNAVAVLDIIDDSVSAQWRKECESDNRGISLLLRLAIDALNDNKEFGHA